MDQTVKNLPAMWETWVWSLGWEDPLDEGMATNSSILAWRIPMDRGAWRATVHRVAQSWTWLKWLHTHTHTHTHRAIYGAGVENGLLGQLAGRFIFITGSQLLSWKATRCFVFSTVGCTHEQKSTCVKTFQTLSLLERWFEGFED